jgi:hypothetical protein
MKHLNKLEYNESVLHNYAVKLQIRAENLVFAYSFRCLVLGAFFMYVFLDHYKVPLQMRIFPCILVSSAAALIGYFIGKFVKFKVNLEKEKILCLIKIAQNGINTPN